MQTGEQLASFLNKGDIVLLKGDLGTGKTHFIKGIARFFDIPGEEVQSPTFSLIHEYPGRIPLYHLDCYRLQSLEEANNLGIQEYLFGDGICLIEWPEKIIPLLTERYLTERYWTVELKHIKENERYISIHQHS